MKSLRIVFLSPFQLRLRRGIERATHHLALNLAQLGQNVALVCRSGDLPQDTLLIENGVRYYVAPPVHYFESRLLVPFFARTLVKLKPDIVIVYFACYGEAPSLKIARTFHPMIPVFYVGYPLALVPQRFNEFKQTGFDQDLGAVVVKAEHMIPPVEAFFQRTVHIVPNGVDVDYFKPVSDVQRPKDSVHRLITTAALEERKGYDLVLDVLPEVIKRVGNVLYMMVGEGPDRQRLVDRVKAMNLESHVTVTGQVDDVRPYLAQSDVFVLPSYGEGLPNAFLEALAMGIPTIVSNDPPYNTIAKPDFSILVDRLDKQAMEDAIVDLLSNPDRRIQMGKAARYHAEQAYSWSRIARRYLDILHDVLATESSLRTG